MTVQTPDVPSAAMERLLDAVMDYRGCVSYDPKVRHPSFNWGEHAELVRCHTHGGHMTSEHTCQTDLVLQDLRAERARQFARYGDNADLVDGVGPTARWLQPYSGDTAAVVERRFRDDYEEYEKDHGAPTWARLLREELAEALAEADPAKLRAELLQVAALSVSWIEKLDARDEAAGA